MLSSYDKRILRSFGEHPDVFPQIEEAISKTKYYLYDKENDKSIGYVKSEKAIEILGKKVFLSGIDRSAFHRTALRYSPDYKYSVRFDSGKLFK